MKTEPGQVLVQLYEILALLWESQSFRISEYPKKYNYHWLIPMIVTLPKNDFQAVPLWWRAAHSAFSFLFHPCW